MTDKKSVSSWNRINTEHNRHRMKFAEKTRIERELMLSRHKAEYDKLRKEQEDAFGILKKRWLEEETAEREKFNFAKKTHKRKSLLDDPVALEPIPLNRQTELEYVSPRVFLRKQHKQHKQFNKSASESSSCSFNDEYENLINIVLQPLE